MPAGSIPSRILHDKLFSHPKLRRMPFGFDASPVSIVVMKIGLAV
jgi:hypothetical protein